MTLRIKVLHHPGQPFPQCRLVDQDGNEVKVEGADTQFHLVCDGGTGLARVALVLDNVAVECAGGAHEVKEAHAA